MLLQFLTFYYRFNVLDTLVTHYAAFVLNGFSQEQRLSRVNNFHIQTDELFLFIAQKAQDILFYPEPRPEQQFAYLRPRMYADGNSK